MNFQQPSDCLLRLSVPPPSTSLSPSTPTPTLKLWFRKFREDLMGEQSPAAGGLRHYIRFMQVAMGGKDGKIYIVFDSSDQDIVELKPRGRSGTP
nr:probable pectate lyase 5 [Ipomoea batatas]